MERQHSCVCLLLTSHQLPAEFVSALQEEQDIANYKQIIDGSAGAVNFVFSYNSAFVLATNEGLTIDLGLVIDGSLSAITSMLIVSTGCDA